MANAIIIDALNQTIRQAVFQSVDDLFRFVGGFLEVAYVWHGAAGEHASVLYVNEGGLTTERPRFFFTLPDAHQWFSGNGVVVGAEITNEDETQLLDWQDPAITLAELERLVVFNS